MFGIVPDGYSKTEHVAPNNLVERVSQGNLGIDELLAINTELNSRRNVPPPLRVEYDFLVRPHPHATTNNFELLQESDYVNALTDLVRARELGAAELNFHLPLEAQFARFRDEAIANRFMDFVDEIGRISGVTPVWENAPILEPPSWRVVQNTDFVPTNRKLCLDTGHWILGSHDQTEALERLDRFWDEHGAQVQHLHIHINDLTHDQHINDPALVIAFLGIERFTRMTRAASFIFERGL